MSTTAEQPKEETVTETVQTVAVPKGKDVAADAGQTPPIQPALLKV